MFGNRCRGLGGHVPSSAPRAEDLGNGLRCGNGGGCMAGKPSRSRDRGNSRAPFNWRGRRFWWTECVRSRFRMSKSSKAGQPICARNRDECRAPGDGRGTRLRGELCWYWTVPSKPFGARVRLERWGPQYGRRGRCLTLPWAFVPLLPRHMEHGVPPVVRQSVSRMARAGTGRPVDCRLYRADIVQPCPNRAYEWREPPKPVARELRHTGGRR